MTRSKKTAKPSPKQLSKEHSKQPSSPPPTITAPKKQALSPLYAAMIVLSLMVMAGSVYAYQIFKEPNFSQSDPGFVKFCSGSDLVVQAQYLGAATNSLVNAIKFINDSDRPCALQGFPDLKISTPSQEFQVSQYHLPAEAKVEIIQPKQAVYSQFIWGNWCGAKPSSSIQLNITIPGTLDIIQSKITDANGKSITGTPSCSSGKGKSSLAVGPFISESVFEGN